MTKYEYYILDKLRELRLKEGQTLSIHLDKAVITVNHLGQIKSINIWQEDSVLDYTVNNDGKNKQQRFYT